MTISGLNTLAQPLSLGPELQAAADVVENAGQIWTSEHVIKILQKKAAEWSLLPTHQEVAAAGVYRHTANCHKWLGTGQCASHLTKQCKFAHEEEFKNRPDLLPICPWLDGHGKCLNNGGRKCHYKHPPGTQFITQECAASAVASAVSQDSVSDLSAIKTMLLAIIKDQTDQQAAMAEQRALITHLLAPDDA